ncbi:MAG: response regulator [Nitrospirae bacterium]|nr:response regulator [Nitrospirota bacterium]MBF0541617.1 response regulator [Nitrospirota bacterium]
MLNKCLIVEDEFLIANSIKIALQDNGYVVTSIAAEGFDAIEQVKLSMPDIILMDITLRGSMDGIETIKQINSIYDIPVIYLTANVNDNIIERAQITEPFGYLIKPVDVKELLVNIKMALYKHTIDAELREINRTLDSRVTEEVEKNRLNDMLLIQQSKMAAMGEMIGAIAHQWRQPLNTINLLAQDLTSAFEYGELNGEYLGNSVNNIMRQVSFMSNTIDDFRNFFKADKEKIPFKINTAVREILYLIFEQITKSDIDIYMTCNYDGIVKKQLSGGFDKIFVCEPELIAYGYPNEFKQAVLNIITNARDAIIESRGNGLYIEDLKPFISIEILKDNDMAVIKFKDNGGGIPVEYIDKVFYPYVTTKKDGTGIGLYMAKTIIEKNMEGRLFVNNIDKGAEFVMELKLKEEV